jgi:putative transposase
LPPWKERHEVAAALKPIYRAVNAESARDCPESFVAASGVGAIRPSPPHGVASGSRLLRFPAYPIEVRRIIYTTNAIKSLLSRLRKAVRLRGHFLSDEAATKLLFLVLREVSREWKMPAREWNPAKTQFAVIFGSRFVVA